MKDIQFDEQQFQIDAVNAVVDIFDGQFATDNSKLQHIERKLGKQDSLLKNMVEQWAIRGNSIEIDDATMHANLRAIQERGGIDPELYGDVQANGRNYTIEMETGTGKTYVYIRTALELARRYGWRKYLIIVPSIPIKEGVINAIDTMRPHFESLYEDVGYFNAGLYDSKDITGIGEFARSDDIELMIVTIDSFNKQDNLMNNEQESLGWQKPIDVLASVRPIVIIDEPQSKMSTDKSKAALARLNPLFNLRYSATHRKGEYYNLMYQLDPVAAHQQNLVKTVYVRSAKVLGSTHKPYVKLVDIRTRPTGGPQALIEVNKRIGGSLQTKQQWVNDNTDLEELTENDAYSGYVLDGISAREGSEHISFEGSSDDLYLGDSIGGLSAEVMKAQLRATITAHLEKERSLLGQGIKVLSLFFIDRVSNYWEADESGGYRPGRIQQWFKEVLSEELAKPRYQDLYKTVQIDDLFDAYFSILRKKKASSAEYLDGDANSKEYKQAEAEAFEKIMKDKKGLLDQSTALRFIFSHSALKEGWDNPNVFQICMMRDSNSPLDRRQTIGRGLRLPVNQQGLRCFDPSINQLTVVATESYEEFAENLQKEYVRDGIVFGRLRSNAFTRIIDPAANAEIGFSASKAIWHELASSGFITENGSVSEHFTPDVQGFSLRLSQSYAPLQSEIIAIMQDYQLRHIIKEDKPVSVHYNKELLDNSDFKDLWHKINKNTTYSVSFETEKLIEKAAELIEQMPKIEPVKVVQTEGRLTYVRGGVDSQDVGGQRTMEVIEVVTVPDIISFLQKETELTRHTLAQILVRSKRLSDLLRNPNDFKFAVLDKISEVTREVQLENIRYTPQTDKPLLSDTTLAAILDKDLVKQLEQLYKVQRKDRTLSDFIPIDSKYNERKFAEKLDNDPNVEVFVKLPVEFKIVTPFGGYNPDWAYVYNDQGHKKLYLVRETKTTLDADKLSRSSERAKVECAKEHFRALEVDYALATGDSPLLQN